LLRAIQISNKPLDRYPILRSADVAEIAHVIRATFGARRFDVAGRRAQLSLHANFWRTSAIMLSFGHHTGAEIEVKYSGVPYFRQFFSLSGTTNLCVGSRECTFSPTTPCLVPANQSLHLKFAPQFENLVLRVDPAFLATKLRAMTGTAGLRVCPDPAQPPNAAGAARLERLIRFLVSELDRQEAPPALFVSEMEQALAVAFLCGNPQLFRKTPAETPPDVCCRQLRIAEDYIDAHWDQPLALENLTEVANVSARSLFHYFRKWRGKTPMQYLKEVRLKHARQMLQQSPDLTITEIAFACGFGNLGHFAHDYRKAWGERPSDTRRGHHHKT
jgi:AraC-like DNA-binding protein